MDGQLLRQPSGLLIDLDGTMYHGGRPIEGAAELIAMLRTRRTPFLFVTNNSSASPETVASRMTAMGIATEPVEVVTSSRAAAAYIASAKPGALVHVVGETGLLEAVRGEGLRIAGDGDPAVDVVLQGIDRQFTYDKLAAAVDRIARGASYVLTNPDLLLPGEHGLLPGAGSIGAAVAAASGTKPVVVGKPSAILMDYALQRLGVRAAETWVVGDNLATDIAAGKASGCGTALVLTGLTTKENMAFYSGEAGVRADAVYEDLRSLAADIAGRTK